MRHHSQMLLLLALITCAVLLGCRAVDNWTEGGKEFTGAMAQLRTNTAPSLAEGGKGLSKIGDVVSEHTPALMATTTASIASIAQDFHTLTTSTAFAVTNLSLSIDVRLGEFNNRLDRLVTVIESNSTRLITVVESNSTIVARRAAGLELDGTEKPWYKRPVPQVWMGLCAVFAILLYLHFDNRKKIK